MYQKIMVPLDGSELAECVLPQVEAIAKGCQVSQVDFVRVLEPIPPSADEGFILTADTLEQIDADRKAAAEDYLKSLVKRLEYNGTEFKWKVIFGKVADSLSEYADQNDIDLIVIATHGRTGISRWAWGSVSDRILRSSFLPILMIRAPGYEPGR
jgi:nucleotide-binding universal stress UspA family protein